MPSAALPSARAPGGNVPGDDPRPQCGHDGRAHHQSAGELQLGQGITEKRSDEKRQQKARAAAEYAHRECLSGVSAAACRRDRRRGTVRGAGIATVARPTCAKRGHERHEANVPQVAHTSSRKLCGSRISSLACGQLELRVVILEIARAHAQPRMTGDHRQRGLPILQAKAQRLRGLGENLGVETCRRRSPRRRAARSRRPPASASLRLMRAPTRAAKRQQDSAHAPAPRRRCDSW